MNQTNLRSIFRLKCSLINKIKINDNGFWSFCLQSHYIYLDEVYSWLIWNSRLVRGKAVFFRRKKSFDDRRDQCHNHDQELILDRGNPNLRF